MKPLPLFIAFLICNSYLFAADKKTIIREDFTGDGRRDLAVWELDNGRVATWKIYRCLQNGSYKYAYELDFHPKAFRIYSSQQGVEFVMYHAAGAGKGRLTTFHLDSDSVHEKSTLEIEGGDSADITHKNLYNKHFGYLWTDPRTEQIEASHLILKDGVLTELKTNK